MNLTLKVWKDKDGNHLEDRGGIGLHFQTRADVVAYLKQRDGEEWEQSFREALRVIAARYSDLDQPLNGQAFTFNPARATTTWL